MNMLRVYSNFLYPTALQLSTSLIQLWSSARLRSFGPRKSLPHQDQFPVPVESAFVVVPKPTVFILEPEPPNAASDGLYFHPRAFGVHHGVLRTLDPKVASPTHLARI